MKTDIVFEDGTLVLYQVGREPMMVDIKTVDHISRRALLRAAGYYMLTGAHEEVA